MNLKSKLKDICIPQLVADWWKTIGRSCITDPTDFFKYCIKVPNKRGDVTNISLYHNQEMLVHHFNLKRIINVTQERQVGVSTVVYGLMLWQSIFKSDQSTVFMSPNHTMARHAADMIRTMYDHLPEELKAGFHIVKNNKMEIEFNNGSRIRFVPASVNKLRGYTINLLVLDQMSFVDRTVADDIIQCVAPTMSGKHSKILNVDCQYCIPIEKYTHRPAFVMRMSHSRV